MNVNFFSLFVRPSTDWPAGVHARRHFQRRHWQFVPGQKSSRSLDSQKGEQAEDFGGSDPGSRAQHPLVEVGCSLGIQAFFPGIFNHSLQLRDVWHCLRWRRTSRPLDEIKLSIRFHMFISVLLLRHIGSSWWKVKGHRWRQRGVKVTLQDGSVCLESLKSREEHLEVPVATTPSSVPRGKPKVVSVCTQPHLDAVGVPSLVIFRQRPHHTYAHRGQQWRRLCSRTCCHGPGVAYWRFC